MPLTTEETRNLIDRNTDLKQTRLLYEPLWEEIAEYIFPRRIGIGYKPTPGQKQTTYMYDSTATYSHALLGASMHGTLTPSSSIWSSFKLRDDRLNKIKMVMDWLEQCANTMSVARHQSNFNSEIHELYLDLCAFGTGCMLIEEKPIYYPGFNGLQYKTLPNSEYCIAENAQGNVDTIFREFELTARAALKKFGKDKLSDKIVKETEKKPDTKFTFIHCIYPKDMEFETAGKKNWVGYYIDIDSKKVVSEAGYYEFPAIVPRWSKSSGEDYGRGPGHTALPDVKTLNKAKEFGLKAWAKDLDPPTFEKDGGVIGSLKLWPGGRNVARDKDAIWTMDHKIRYDVSQIKEEELRTSIRQIFYSDQLKLQEGPEMTATEVQVRYELMQRLLGPTLGRFEGEGLNPLIEREFGIMMRATSGRYQVLPPPPPIMAQLGITEIDIEYEGPLAKSQRMGEMVRMQRVAGLAGTLAQGFGIEIFDNFDGDEVMRHAAEVEGVPSKLIRSVEEVAAIRKERAKAQAAEAQKQDLERIMAGAKNAAPMLKAIGEARNAQETTNKAAA